MIIHSFSFFYSSSFSPFYSSYFRSCAATAACLYSVLGVFVVPKTKIYSNLCMTHAMDCIIAEQSYHFCDCRCCCGCCRLCDWLDGRGDRFIDSINLDRTRLTGPSSLLHILNQTIFHFGSSQLHGLFVEANLHETIQLVEYQSTPSQKQTAPLRAQKNTKVMMMNWSII